MPQPRLTHSSARTRNSRSSPCTSTLLDSTQTTSPSAMPAAGPAPVEGAPEDIGADRWLEPEESDPDVAVDVDANLDLDADGTVTVADLVDLLARLGPCGECDADLDDDGDVDTQDVARFFAAWRAPN